MGRERTRRVLGVFNRLFMVPVFRLGLGPFVGNPLTGYVMVLKTVGHRSGRVRYAPVNYAIIDGHVYCASGWGRSAAWHRNLTARPSIEVLMPGGVIAGVAVEVTDSDEAAAALRRILENSGFAAVVAGLDPRTLSDDEVRRRAQRIPVVRIGPTGIGSGAGDPGGWAWIPAVLAHLWLVRRLARRH